MTVLRTTVLIAVALLLVACGQPGNAIAIPALTPAEPAGVTPVAEATPSPRQFTEADLGHIVLSSQQMGEGGWQTATRPDLTGPFTATLNTGSDERPPVVTAGFVAGYRQTIGNPGGTGANMKRTQAMIYASNAESADGEASYGKAFRALGYSDVLDPGGLPPGMHAAMGRNVPVGQGSSIVAVAFSWVVGNLVVIHIVGGDAALQVGQARNSALLVASNLPSATTPPVPPRAMGRQLAIGDAEFDLVLTRAITADDSFVLEFSVPNAGQNTFLLCGPMGGLGPTCTAAPSPLVREFTNLPTAGAATYRFGIEHGSDQPQWFADGSWDFSQPVVVTETYR